MPTSYPLSLNALTAGCNQKNNRNPVLNTSGAGVQAAIDRLMPLSLVIESSGSRVMRYSQNIGRFLKVPSEAVALLAALWLRGPQTAAELRAATKRYTGSPMSVRSKASSHSSPNARKSQPRFIGAIATVRPRRTRASRWVDLLSPAAEIAERRVWSSQAEGRRRAGS